MLAAPLVLAAAAATHPFSVDDMLAMERISQAVVSPDGKQAVFTLRTTDLEANRGRQDLWLVPTAGGAPRRLTSHPENDHSAAFLPDGRSVLFLSTRSGSQQVHRLSLDGGEAEAVTSLPIDVEGMIPFPDGKRLLLILDVYPDAAGDVAAETQKRDEAKAKGKVKALAYDQLMFRHWDGWEDGKRLHLFVWSPGQPLLDLTKGLDCDSPPKPFGGSEEVAIAPDGKSVVFAAKCVGREAAWSTNVDLWRVPADGSAKPVAITSDNPATDHQPLFSPDGKSLAWLAMARPGYEADRQRITLLDLASNKRRLLAADWDRSAGELTFAADGKTLFTTADHLGQHALFAIDVGSGQVKLLADQGTFDGPRLAGDRLLVARDSLASPVELFTLRPDGGDLRPLTRINGERLARIQLGEYEQFTFKGAKGDQVHGFVMKPAGFQAGKKYPLVMLVHGGPQGSFGNHFHYRWNPQAYAGRGFATVFIDFHGSTGYGQAFSDAIRGDWGGAPFEDLMKGLDAALARYPFLDGNRAGAAGASYGGYQINWMNGHTNRFKALVCHDGNLDETMAYYDTEELWFPEWDHLGTPWDNPEGYAAQSPLRFVKQWQTPTLVVHGGKDFRVVETQGMSTFTALQRRGIPSRFLYFPDENHWVLKPQSSKRWHDEVLGWLDRWLKR